MKSTLRIVCGSLARTTGYCILLAMLGGCTVYKEGIMLGSPGQPDVETLLAIDERLEQYRQEAITAAQAAPDDPAGVILIGRLGPLRSYSNEGMLVDEYQAYEERMKKMNKQDRMLSLEELRRYAGWTTLTIERVPLLYFRMSGAVVTQEQQQNLVFPWAATTVLLGTRGDLVAARHTTDKDITVITDRLCADGPRIPRCANQYEIGIYELHSGRQLTHDFHIKKNGITIDTSTFKKRLTP